MRDQRTLSYVPVRLGLIATKVSRTLANIILVKSERNGWNGVDFAQQFHADDTSCDSPLTKTYTRYPIIGIILFYLFPFTDRLQSCCFEIIAMRN